MMKWIASFVFGIMVAGAAHAAEVSDLYGRWTQDKENVSVSACRLYFDEFSPKRYYRDRFRHKSRDTYGTYSVKPLSADQLRVDIFYIDGGHSSAVYKFVNKQTIVNTEKGYTFYKCRHGYDFPSLGGELSVFGKIRLRGDEMLMAMKHRDIKAFSALLTAKEQKMMEDASAEELDQIFDAFDDIVQGPISRFDTQSNYELELRSITEDHSVETLDAVFEGNQVYFER